MLVVALRNIKLGTDIVCCCKIAPVPALVPMGSPPCPCHLCPWGVLGSCRSDKQEAFRAQLWPSPGVWASPGLPAAFWHRWCKGVKRSTG